MEQNVTIKCIGWAGTILRHDVAFAGTQGEALPLSSWFVRDETPGYATQESMA
jgi:hypothetical protein